MKKIKINASIKDLFRILSAKISTTKNNKYLYLPYWFKDIGNDLFEVIRFSNLPKNLTDYIKKNRHLKYSSEDITLYKSLQSVINYNLTEEIKHYEELYDVKLSNNISSKEILKKEHILYDLLILQEFLNTI